MHDTHLNFWSFASGKKCMHYKHVNMVCDNNRALIKKDW